MKRYTKGFLLNDFEQKISSFQSLNKENESSKVIVVAKDFDFQGDFKSKIAGELFFLHVISSVRGLNSQSYPISIYGSFIQNDKESVYKELLTNANQATNAVSKYVVKFQDDVLDIAVGSVLQFEKNQEREM